MHETSLMRDLIETASQVLKNKKIKRVDRVVLSVGKLSNVLPEALSFAFDALTQDGIMKGAVLEMEQFPARARCGGCGFEYEVGSFPILCPVCKSRDFTIISGEEVYIQSIYCEENKNNAED